MAFIFKFLIYLFIFTSLPAGALKEEQALVLTFFDIEAIAQQQDAPSGQLIEIRGFLYETNDHHPILAAEPNLKSCCVGSSSKRNRQLLVIGDSPSINQTNAITLKGNLKVDFNDSFPFKLENAEIVANKNQNKTLFPPLIAAAVLFLGLYVWYKKKN